MSFYSDKKQEHAANAERALDRGEWRQAAFHLAKAAEFALKLAERTEGRIRRTHLVEARELVGMAEELQRKAAAVQQQRGGSSLEPGPEAAGDAAEDWLVKEKPTLRLGDVAGLEEVKAKLAEMVIEPLRHPDKARQWGIRPGGGILLYGPPGNGKTTLARAVAGELEADFFFATGAEIRSKWHGESEQRLRRLIQAARSRPVSVLFLDDLDGLLPRRGGQSVVDNRLVVQFLNEIGGFTESNNTLLLLGATNRPWEIDEAVFRTGRFDEKIFVGLPDQTAREFIIRRHLEGVRCEPDLTPVKLAARLEGYVGADIVGVVQSAKRAGFRRALAGGRDELTWADVEQAMRTIPSSVTPALMRQYERFARQRFGVSQLGGRS